MISLQEIEKKKIARVNQLITMNREEDCPRCYREGFDACMALMMEREKKAQADAAELVAAIEMLLDADYWERFHTAKDNLREKLAKWRERGV